MMDKRNQGTLRSELNGRFKDYFIYSFLQTTMAVAALFSFALKVIFMFKVLL